VPVRAGQKGTDAVVARLAAAQGGVVGRRQLLAAGVSRHAIDGRMASGLFTPVFAAVYAVGCPTPPPLGWRWAAVLAAGQDAALSNDSAASALLGLRDPASVWHVTTTGRARPRPRLVVHRVRSLPPEEVTLVDGVRCTTVARTLVDLAATTSDRRLEQALDRAESLRMLDGTALAAASRPGRPGAARLRQVMDLHAAGSTVTRSELEELFLRFCRDRGLPAPQTNVHHVLPSGTPIVIDALWRGAGVAIELDSRAWHMDTERFERDRGRDLELEGTDFVTGRVTWRMLTREGDWLEQQLRRLLDVGARRAARAGLPF
jgi:hypothetical protein